jgi:hypothetical protein
MQNSTLFYRVATSLFAVALMYCTNAQCAEFTIINPGGKGLMINMKGEIEKGDDVRFSIASGSAKSVWLYLDSVGGEPETAMRIGSLLRQKNGWVMAKRCYSSCVLIFAGGIYRTGYGRKAPVVGVHRIYFGQLPAELTSDQVKALYDQTLQHIRDYLAKMNVAPELLSYMQSFEPENIHVLSKSELRRFGLGENDPVFMEREVADRAKSMGISSLELRMRFAKLGQCRGIQGSGPERTEAMFVKWPPPSRH